MKGGGGQLTWYFFIFFFEILILNHEAIKKKLGKKPFSLRNRALLKTDPSLGRK